MDKINFNDLVNKFKIKGKSYHCVTDDKVVARSLDTNFEFISIDKDKCLITLRTNYFLDEHTYQQTLLYIEVKADNQININVKVRDRVSEKFNMIVEDDWQPVKPYTFNPLLPTLILETVVEVTDIINTNIDCLTNLNVKLVIWHDDDYITVTDSDNNLKHINFSNITSNTDNKVIKLINNIFDFKVKGVLDIE